MKHIEEDNVIVTLCNCWIDLYNPKAPLNTYEQTISNLNELSDKFGYTLKTFNLLGVVLMIQGEVEKASKIFQNVLDEYDIYGLCEKDPTNSLFAPTNHDLSSLIYNYIKCNAI